MGEVRQVKEILRKLHARLKRQGVKVAPVLPKLGVMIEVPGAALAADALAMECDFFAIGTNDLIQYTLAIDRSDEQVAYLYNPLHPAVLRLIQFAVEAALRARKPVCLCGEMAGDPRYTALLLGLGIRDLSMATRPCRASSSACAPWTSARRRAAPSSSWPSGIRAGSRPCSTISRPWPEGAPRGGSAATSHLCGAGALPYL